MDVFGSFKSSIPSKEMYDVIGTPSFGNPLTLYLRNSSDLVINLKGTQLGKQGCSSNCDIRIEPGNNIRGKNVHMYSIRKTNWNELCMPCKVLLPVKSKVK